MHVPACSDGTDPVAARTLGPAEIVTVAEPAANERGLFLAKADTAALAGLADDGEIS